MTRIRADLLLVARGLAPSRAKAREAIEAGGVRADGEQVERPADLIAADAVLELHRPYPWVSRGGVKLAHALDAFGINPAGQVCLDVGASTGGFTEVLLSRGASCVFAVDVGHGQLHAQLAADPRVVSLERTDARALTGRVVTSSPSLIVCDVSFIGAVKALGPALSLAAPRADLVVLIKPQFEAGPHKRAVLEEADARAAAQIGIGSLEGLSGFRKQGAIDSPIRGGDGNLELLAHFQRS